MGFRVGIDINTKTCHQFVRNCNQTLHCCWFSNVSLTNSGTNIRNPTSTQLTFWLAVSQDPVHRFRDQVKKHEFFHSGTFCFENFAKKDLFAKQLGWWLKSHQDYIIEFPKDPWQLLCPDSAKKHKWCFECHLFMTFRLKWQPQIRWVFICWFRYKQAYRWRFRNPAKQLMW